MRLTYSDLQIATLDEQYLDDLSKAYGIDWTDLPIDIDGELDGAYLCNAIMWELLTQIAYQEVENPNDRSKIVDSIYCNCLDSGYDIDSDSLESEQAKEFIDNF